MDITTVLILSLIGLLAGTMGGMVGLGGGLIIVPAMVYLMGADQKTAQGTSTRRPLSAMKGIRPRLATMPGLVERTPCGSPWRR